jgi:Protein of unknown function (DUF2934)
MANNKGKKMRRGDSVQGNQPIEPPISDHELRRRIAEKAYELYERRGRVPGQEVGDWLEAERMVMAEFNSQGVKKPRPLRRRRMRSQSR